MKLIPIIILGFALSLCNLAEKFKGDKNSNSNSNSSSSNSKSSGKSDLPSADKPEPTAAQTAALAGGSTISWDQQGIKWTVPAKWTEVSNSSSTQFHWKSPGSWDAGFLIANISVMDSSFPTDVSLKATYDQTVGRQKNGQVAEVRWLELDGVKGVQFLETPPEGKEDPRRLQWIAYRKFGGQTQMVNLILSSQGQHFHMHQDALYGILYSTRVVHD